MSQPEPMLAPERRQAIEELIYRSCLALDAKDFKAFLELCDEDFRYTIATYSPEIRREMVWLDHDRKGMETLFTNLPKHNSDHSPITRHATVYTVDMNGSTADVVSALQVFRTQLDGGATELFAVGRFHDTVKVDGTTARLARRVVRLETRLLSYGYHIPF
ncbi:MAG: nuclear transport factor 2 family protein [Burkholderiales bacterium]